MKEPVPATKCRRARASVVRRGVLLPLAGAVAGRALAVPLLPKAVEPYLVALVAAIAVTGLVVAVPEPVAALLVAVFARIFVCPRHWTHLSRSHNDRVVKHR